MKKFYLFLALVLTIVGIGVTRALVAESDGGYADHFEAGMQFIIGNDITNENGVFNEDVGQYTHTFGNAKILLDNGNENNTVAVKTGVNLSFADGAYPEASWVWTLVDAGDDAFYLQNAETGKYVSFEVPDVDPTDVDALPTTRKRGAWWRAGNEENGYYANCELPLTLVDDVANAKVFMILSPEDGVEMVRPDALDNNDAALDLAGLVEGEAFMLVASVGHGMYAAVNSSMNGAMTRWCDWAAYYRLVEATVYDDAELEFTRYIQNVSVPEYRLGNDPGCVVEAARAEEVATRLQELKDVLDDEGGNPDGDFWRGLLAEAKSLVAEMEAFTFRPMVPGYYRFINAMAGFEEQQGVQKAMCAVPGAAKWATLDEGEFIVRIDTIYGEGYPEDPEDYELEEVTTDKRGGMDQVWEVTEKGGKFYVKNIKTQQYFVNGNNQSAAVAMGKDEQWVEFTRLTCDFNMHVEGKGFALHAGGHQSGAGESGNIVPWDGGSKTCSAWYMVTVTEAEIAELWGENAIAEAALEAEYKDVLAEAKALLETAQNSAKPTCEIIDPVIDEDNKVFTTADNDGTHVTSPCSDQTEGNIDNLLDGIIGDGGNFWHSDWHGTYNGKWCDGYHYVQFDLKQGYQKLAMYYVPRVRPAGNTNSFEGWPQEFTIYYTNTPDDEASWKKGVAFGENDIDTDYDADRTIVNRAVEYYLPFYIAESARYVRVVCTKGYAWRNSNKFWMAGEMNFCTYEGDVIYDDGFSTFDKANDQGNGCGDALVAAVAHADEVVENKGINADELAALKAALDTFKNNYTDFTQLQQLITDARELLKVFPEGGVNPGQKPQAAIDALRAAQVAASDWLAANKKTCTKAELDAAVAKLQVAIDEWEDVPVATFNTNTWYYINVTVDRTSNVDNAYYNRGTQLKGGKMAHQFADLEALDAIGYRTDNYLAAVSDSMTAESNYVADAAQWRFVWDELTETYAVQNRATGNFLPVADKANKSGNIMAAPSPMPGRYLINYVGGGKYELATYYGAKNDEGEKLYTYINQFNNGNIGFWTTGANGDPASAWQIVIAEPIASNYQAEVAIGLDSMAVRGLTLPYAVEVEEGTDIYDEVGAISTESKLVGLNAASDTIAAGKPFFALSQKADVHTLYVKMASDKFSWAVDKSNIFGTMALNDTIQAGVAIPSYTEMGGEWGAFKVIGEEQHIEAGSAWIDIHSLSEAVMKTDPEDCDNFVVLLDDEAELADVIEVVRNEQGKITDVIYNLNGQRVSSPVKGIVIMNGKKVIIK